MVIIEGFHTNMTCQPHVATLPYIKLYLNHITVMTGGNESPYGQKNLKWDSSENRFQQRLGRRKANELQCSAMERDTEERFRTGANHEVESKVLVSGI